ncbi:MAG TPA: hypothetical protein DDW46_02565 [Dehalococcoidia bacterium]|jgi:hypothetical protein|nr:hypothetical protein [Dehalococcoidia bacterium]
MNELINILKLPYVWGGIGAVLGAGLGVNNLSIWLLAVLLGLFFVTMRITGPPEEGKEGRLFAGGSLLMVGWVLAFSIRGIVI